MVSWLWVVAYRFVASLTRAVFSSQALLPICRALVNTSLAPAARSRASRIRMSDRPMSSRTAIALRPSDSMLPRPWINWMMAPAASSSKAAANSAADIPATSANCSSPSPPCWTASDILEIRVENAEPPASASMPTEDRAPEKDMISASVMPTCAPAPAMRILMSTISFSVVARLLPRSTMVAPSRSKSSWDIPVMFARRERLVAASSAVMLVDVPSMAMISVKSSRDSLWMPSWPADSAMAASSSVVAGISVDISLMASDMADSSSSVRSVVLATPVIADSKSIDAWAQSAKYS